MQERIAVIGLGYVGLPVALAFARKFPGTIGFDISKGRIDALRDDHDWTGEATTEDLRASTLELTHDPTALREATFFIVAVPTPIDESKRPNLAPLTSATEAVAGALHPGAVVVFESTVYPGVTEEVCGPILEEVSGLRQGVDFKLGYSPERINPGDKEHTFEKIKKVVSAEDDESLERVASAYGAVVEAGVFRAASIKVAEAAKVIENTQRDLNIALMNELALIFDRMGIRTRDVLDAAGTKWNFLPFTPGLVGGHCIGVDPYYLTAKAETVGYHPEVILAGRRINDSIGSYVAERVVKLLCARGNELSACRVGVLGLTFKENVPDLRNSRVPDIVEGLTGYGLKPLVHDPLASKEGAREEYGISLCDLGEAQNLDALILAVPHRDYMSDLVGLLGRIKQGGVLIDVKSAVAPSDVPDGIAYWSL